MTVGHDVGFICVGLSYGVFCVTRPLQRSCSCRPRIEGITTYDMGLRVHFHKCVWHVYYLTRSNIRQQDFLACAVEFSTPMAHLLFIRLGFLSKKPCTVAESKVNVGWKLDRSENLRDFDHHDTVETWKPGAVVIGLFTPIQEVTIVEGQTEEWRGVALVSNFSFEETCIG
jgi:hypothetical protein